jgi:hypothetical protein
MAFTLSNKDMAEEANRLVNDLEDSFERMAQGERTFVEQLAERFDRYGWLNVTISEKQLNWLKDLSVKYA